MPSRLIFLSLCALLSCTAILMAATPGPASPRQRLLLDHGWRFTNGDPAGTGDTLAYPERENLAKVRISEIDSARKLEDSRTKPAAGLGANLSWVQPSFDDSSWRKLNLPHDWFVELPYVPENDRSAPDPVRNPRNSAQGSRDVRPGQGTNIGWYRRTFDLPASDSGLQISVLFEGVFRNSLVWFNGHCLGRHVSGYTSFTCDLTPYANFGGKNTLVVRVDASHTTGWFYEGAGIYRHVWLVKTSPLHVAPWGTYVTSELNDSLDAATITAQTTIRNFATAPVANARLISAILDPSGRTVAETSTQFESKPGAGTTLTQHLPVERPQLWSPDTPSLYRLVSRIEQGKTTADIYDTTFGIRTVVFDGKDHGILLNGKRTPIKGTNNHQDHAGVGIAIPDRLQEFRVEKLKDLGTNAYRSAHNPAAPALLDACDRLGLLVMDENRYVGSNPEALAEFRDLIIQHRNHPSIFMWSFGNEETEIQGNDEIGKPIAQAMVSLAHSLDPTRLVTCAMNEGWGRGFTTTLDVMAYNYWRNNGNIDKTHEDFPNLPSLSAEECSAFSTRGYYGPSGKGLSSSYDEIREPNTYRDTFESAMRYYARRPFLAGYFVWTGFDYRGEPAPFGWPQVSSNFGILDTCGFPKDAAYFHKAWWGGQPILHIFPHWNWSGKEGQPIRIWAYGAWDEVELFLNGKSLGRQPMPRQSHIEWTVPYTPGTLIAKAYKDGKPAAETKVETTGAPAALKLTPDRTTLRGDGEDVSIITVSAVDEKGRPVPTASNLVKFKIEGEGATILGVGNGDPTSREPDSATSYTIQPDGTLKQLGAPVQRHLFNGLAQIIIQSPRNAAKFTLTAESENLASATAKLQSDNSGQRPSVP